MGNGSKRESTTLSKISLLRDKSLKPFGEHSFGYFFGHNYTDGCIIASFISSISMSVNIEIHYSFY